MGTCRCPGGKTVKFTPGKPKKQSVKKAAIAKSSGKPSKRSQKLSAAAKKKNSGGCSCTQ